jgi:hypothetical protein
MDLFRARPVSPRARSHVCALLLLALAGCGRVGFELLPNSLGTVGGRDPDRDDEDDERESPTMGAADAEMDAADADVDAAPVAMDAAAPAPQDAAVVFDATDSSVGVADTSVGMTDTSVGPADTSVAPADTSVGAVDAASNDASQPATGMRIVVDNSAGGTLRDFPVLVRLDTRALIQQGRLAADCSNLRISGGAGCAQARSFFLPPHACNSATSELWLRVPELLAGAREVFAVSFTTSGETSSGSRVFPFFDDFEGGTLDRTRWTTRGTGSVSVSAGVLQGQGVMQLESLARAVSAGQSVVGARVAMLGSYDTDVELGAGVVGGGTTIWAPGRIWDGITFASHDFGTYAFDGPAGSSCDDLADSTPTPQIGAAWVDRPPATAAFLTAEFGYAVRAGTASGWLRTSRGASLTYTAPNGCGLPTTLPVLITLDHNAPDAPIQRVEYVYVRPAATSEPSTIVQSASSLSCGSAP